MLDGAGHIIKGIQGETIVNTDTPSIENITATFDLTNLTIENFNIHGEFDLVRFGINFYRSSGFNVINNSVSSTYIAIELGGSENIVSGNKITDTEHMAIQIGDNSVIIGNTIVYASGMKGIAVAMSSNSTVIGNLIEDSDYGIYTFTYGGFLYPDATPPETSIVYGNNFINNLRNVINDGIEGASIGKLANWDNGSIGNYWSDYKSKYPNALEIDHTGVGNTPYVMDTNNIDYHPLMNLVQVSQIINSFYSSTSSSQNIVNSSSNETLSATQNTSSPTSTPTVPEFPWFVLPLFISVISATALLRFEKEVQLDG